MRVTNIEKGAHEDVSFFEVYGATLIGTNTIVTGPLETRALQITMKQADKNFLMRI